MPAPRGGHDADRDPFSVSWDARRPVGRRPGLGACRWCGRGASVPWAACRRRCGRARQGRTWPAAGSETPPASCCPCRPLGRRARSGPCGGAPAPSRPAGRRSGGEGAAALARIAFTTSTWAEPRGRSALPLRPPFPPSRVPGLPRPVRAAGRRAHSGRGIKPGAGQRRAGWRPGGFPVRLDRGGRGRRPDRETSPASWGVLASRGASCAVRACAMVHRPRPGPQEGAQAAREPLPLRASPARRRAG